ncbi:MAG: response regulator [Methanospirillaceae archaeon]|nr:response regulator [Methanospirillaceae archaeon]
MEPEKTPGSLHSVVSILVVEDEEDHLDLIRRAFRDNSSFELSYATTLAEATKKIDAGPPDLVIADWLLPDGKGEELLLFVVQNFPIPFIIMTRHGDEQIAAQIIKAGAIDYGVKSSFTFFDLPRIADRAVREFRNSIDRDAVQEALMQSEEKFFRIFHGSPVLTLIVRCSDHIILDLNAIFEKKTGYRRSEPVGRTLTETGLWTDSRDPNAVVGI